MDYAIIKLGNKQHRVRDGETLVVDRLHADAGKSFEPVVLLGEGTVTATVIAHERGPKILIGKYRKRTGYKRHNGFRAATSRVEISLGGGRAEGAKAAANPVATTTPAAVTPAAVTPDVATAEAGALAAPAETPVAAEGTSLPEGYGEMTVAQVTAGVREWTRPEIEAALAFEQEHAARKGALSVLEGALAKEDG
jgi:large subunit ribosomal protein L21